MDISCHHVTHRDSILKAKSHFLEWGTFTVITGLIFSLETSKQKSLKVESENVSKINVPGTISTIFKMNKLLRAEMQPTIFCPPGRFTSSLILVRGRAGDKTMQEKQRGHQVSHFISESDMSHDDDNMVDEAKWCQTRPWIIGSHLKWENKANYPRIIEIKWTFQLYHLLVLKIWFRPFFYWVAFFFSC